MLDNKTMVKVTNRDNGRTGYTVPDLNNLHRVFEYKETKEISVEELRKLSYIPGGMYILKEYLQIHNEELVNELLNGVEVEYNYTEEDIKNLLLAGSIDELHDCLNFAPEGVVNILKQLAVTLEVNDLAKRELITEKTGFHVTAAITHNKEALEDMEEVEKAKPQRRVTPKTTTEEKPATRIIKKA